MTRFASERGLLVVLFVASLGYCAYAAQYGFGGIRKPGVGFVPMLTGIALAIGSTRRRFVFAPGMAHVPSVAAPDIRNRSYSITAEVVMPAAGAERSAAGAEGVVIAHGDSCAGYSLYVRNGRLVHDYNFVGTHYVVTSDVPVSPGPCALRFEFTKTGRYAGIGRLFIDAKQVGEIAIPQTMPAVISWEGARRRA